MHGLQGRVTPKAGWTLDVVLKVFDHSIIDDFKTISARIYLEGYQMWSGGKVMNCFSNSKLYPSHLFFRADVKAAMKQKVYTINLCLHTFSGMTLKWSVCGCPAGVDGECKHIVAVLLYIHHHVTLQECTFPEAIPPTDQTQVWHIKKPDNDNPILFMDTKSSKKLKASKEDDTFEYAAAVDITKCVTQDSLRQLCHSLPEELQISSTIKENGFFPVIGRGKILGLHYINKMCSKKLNNEDFLALRFGISWPQYF